MSGYIFRPSGRQTDESADARRRFCSYCIAYALNQDEFINPAGFNTGPHASPGLADQFRDVIAGLYVDDCGLKPRMTSPIALVERDRRDTSLPATFGHHSRRYDENRTDHKSRHVKRAADVLTIRQRVS